MGRVYTEAEIAGMLGTSRTPVREALVDLVRQGIVEKVRQKGFRLRQSLELERVEVYELRKLIESYVVRRLAAEALPQHVTALEAILRRQQEAINDTAAFSEAGEELHLAMPHLLGLSRTAEILETLRGMLWVFGAAATEQHQRPEQVLDEHREIVQAIARRDRRAALRALLIHLRKTADAVKASNLGFDAPAGR